jgi:hypothetical protein
MRFDIETFMEMKLSPNAYLLLYAIVIDDLDLYNHIIKIIIVQTGTEDIAEEILIELQLAGYIKITLGDEFTLRQKALDLRAQINPEPQFDEFWKSYHEYAKKFNSVFRATDKEAAEKYWKKLTKKEKELAFNNYKLFINATCETMGVRYIKKGYTYLRDKSFNDEFSYKEEKSSINKMI